MATNLYGYLSISVTIAMHGIVLPISPGNSFIPLTLLDRNQLTTMFAVDVKIKQ